MSEMEVLQFTPLNAIDKKNDTVSSFDDDIISEEEAGKTANSIIERCLSVDVKSCDESIDQSNLSKTCEDSIDQSNLDRSCDESIDQSNLDKSSSESIDQSNLDNSNNSMDDSQNANHDIESTPSVIPNENPDGFLKTPNGNIEPLLKTPDKNIDPLSRTPNGNIETSLKTIDENEPPSKIIDENRDPHLKNHLVRNQKRKNLTNNNEGTKKVFKGIRSDCPTFCRNGCTYTHHHLLVAARKMVENDTKSTKKFLEQVGDYFSTNDESGKPRKVSELIYDSSKNTEYPLLHYLALMGKCSGCFALVDFGHDPVDMLTITKDCVLHTLVREIYNFNCTHGHMDILLKKFKLLLKEFRTCLLFLNNDKQNCIQLCASLIALHSELLNTRKPPYRLYQFSKNMFEALIDVFEQDGHDKSILSNVDNAGNTIAHYIARDRASENLLNMLRGLQVDFTIKNNEGETVDDIIAKAPELPPDTILERAVFSCQSNKEKVSSALKTKYTPPPLPSDKVLPEGNRGPNKRTIKKRDFGAEFLDNPKKMKQDGKTLKCKIEKVRKKTNKANTFKIKFFDKKEELHSPVSDVTANDVSVKTEPISPGAPSQVAMITSFSPTDAINTSTPLTSVTSESNKIACSISAIQNTTSQIKSRTSPKETIMKIFSEIDSESEKKIIKAINKADLIVSRNVVTSTSLSGVLVKPTSTSSPITVASIHPRNRLGSSDKNIISPVEIVSSRPPEKVLMMKPVKNTSNDKIIVSNPVHPSQVYHRGRYSSSSKPPQPILPGPAPGSTSISKSSSRPKDFHPTMVTVKKTKKSATTEGDSPLPMITNVKSLKEDASKMNNANKLPSSINNANNLPTNIALASLSSYSKPLLPKTSARPLLSAPDMSATKQYLNQTRPQHSFINRPLMVQTSNGQMVAVGVLEKAIADVPTQPPFAYPHPVMRGGQPSPRLPQPQPQIIGVPNGGYIVHNGYLPMQTATQHPPPPPYQPTSRQAMQINPTGPPNSFPSELGAQRVPYRFYQPMPFNIAQQQVPPTGVLPRIQPADLHQPPRPLVISPASVEHITNGNKDAKKSKNLEDRISQLMKKTSTEALSPRDITELKQLSTNIDESAPPVIILDSDDVTTSSERNSTPKTDSTTLILNASVNSTFPKDEVAKTLNERLQASGKTLNERLQASDVSITERVYLERRDMLLWNIEQDRKSKDAINAEILRVENHVNASQKLIAAKEKEIKVLKSTLKNDQEQAKKLRNKRAELLIRTTRLEESLKMMDKHQALSISPHADQCNI